MNYEDVNKILDNYYVIEVRDSWDDEVIDYMFLNKKHSVEEFQDDIYKAKELSSENRNKYGDDWYWIEETGLLEKYDYILTPSADYWVEY